LAIHEIDEKDRYVADYIIRDPEQVRRKISEFDHLVSYGRMVDDVASVEAA